MLMTSGMRTRCGGMPRGAATRAVHGRQALVALGAVAPPGAGSVSLREMRHANRSGERVRLVCGVWGKCVVCVWGSVWCVWCVRGGV